MKTNGLRSVILKGIFLVILSLYFLLVFGANGTRIPTDLQYRPSVSAENSVVDTPMPRLLSFEGMSSNKQVKLYWKFETTEGLDQCILERADKSGKFQPVAYFFMTEDIHIPNLKFTDNVPGNHKLYYYRLRIMGKDGHEEFTKALSFNIRKTEQERKTALSEPLVSH